MRHLQLPTLFLILALAGCAPGSHVTTQQVISDISIALDGLSRAVPALAAQKPPAVPAAVAKEAMLRIAQARELVASVGPGTPSDQAGTALMKADAYLNAVLTALSGLALPPPYGTAVTAAIVLEPIISASIQAFISNQQPAVRESVAMGSMSPDQARAALAATH